MAPTVSTGNFSTDKPFVTPNSEVLSFGLFKHWAHDFGSVTY